MDKNTIQQQKKDQKNAPNPPLLLPQMNSNKSNVPKVNFTYQSQSQQVSPSYQQQIPISQMQNLQIDPSNQNKCLTFEISQNVQQQYPIQICPQYYPNSGRITLLHSSQNEEQEKKKEVVALIVTFVNGCTYDPLFTSVQQKSKQGTRVLVYSCQSSFVINILETLKDYEAGIAKVQDEKEKENLKDLIRYMKQLDPDCVVFNWECSSSYGSQTFPEGKNSLFEFLQLVIDRGHMAMFSDFSLKSLINEWSVPHLGPNPFVKVGETSTAVQLYFKSEDLNQCPSAQLQIVGEMAEGGKVHVQVMGGTIVYTVKEEKDYAGANQFYKLQVLTICGEPKCEDDQNIQMCSNNCWPQMNQNVTKNEQTTKIEKIQNNLKIGDKTGTAGHVLLTYNKSGGHLLASMSHWAQLMKIDTSDKKLFQMAEKQYGASVAAQMKMQYMSMDATSQRAYVSREAVNMVQNQAPCSNMAMKSAKGKY